MLDPVSNSLERYMNLLAVRQKLVASNIANADTPGFKTRDIDFQAEFQAAGNPAPNVIEAPDLVTHNDGNNVNIDREARLLAENSIRFGVAGALLRARLQMVRSAIQEGRS